MERRLSVCVCVRVFMCVCVCVAGMCEKGRESLRQSTCSKNDKSEAAATSKRVGSAHAPVIISSRKNKPGIYPNIISIIHTDHQAD